VSAVATRTPEERVERVRMALAEMGYIGVVVGYDEVRGLELYEHEVPREVGWRAFAVAGEPGLACWPCWLSRPFGHPAENCEHDPMSSPWPDVV
jgi:hypothetical protein